MRILLLGKNGQVGWELHRTLAPLGDVIAVDYPEIDFAVVDSVLQFIRKIQPDIIVNAVAYTDVDRAESEQDLAMAVNGKAPKILAEEARLQDAGLIHFSTDFVFDGAKGEPYTEQDISNPINVYGETKLAGERAIQEIGGAYLIFRTSMVYSLRRGCFVTNTLKWARDQEILQIVSDQTGSPTWCRMLAEITAKVLSMGKPNIFDWLKNRKGLYHLAGSGSVSRIEWAKAILQLDPNSEEHICSQIIPVDSTVFPTPAVRPVNSTLNCDRFQQTFGLVIPPWDSTLRLAMEN